MWIVVFEIWFYRFVKFLVVKVRNIFGREGFPFFQSSVYGSLDEQEGDLFCGVKQHAGRKVVVLRVESISPGEGKQRRSMTSLFALLGFASVAILTWIKAKLWEKVPFYQYYV